MRLNVSLLLAHGLALAEPHLCKNRYATTWPPAALGVSEGTKSLWWASFASVTYHWCPILGVQMFLTKDRGWGVHSKEPIPKGTFIIEYAGMCH